MRNLIYYPNFEPQDLSWLKYALIYLEEFSPVIPVRGLSALSDEFSQIRGETNLINEAEPTWQQAEVAVNLAIEKIGAIRTNPGHYQAVFNHPDIASLWTAPERWNERLYNEKFNMLFADYCVGNQLGRRVNNDLMLSGELAGLYMTCLADVMAYERQASLITDVPEVDRLSTFLRTGGPRQEGLLTAMQHAVDLYLPVSIEQIQIEQLIAFRNNSEMRELRTSFNRTLETFYDQAGHNYDPYTYDEILRNASQPFFEKIALTLGTCAVVTLGCVLATNHAALQVTQEVLNAGVAAGGFRGVMTEWQNSRDERNARKFLTNVRHLSA